MATYNDVETCVQMERRERAAARMAKAARVRDLHVMKAERYADRAWSLAVAAEGPYLPSGLWDQSGGTRPAAG
jgi:hypothetical protein